VDENALAIIAAGAAVQYLKDTEHHNLAHFTKLAIIHQSESVWLDKFTIRNLELIYPSAAGGKALIDVMDYTVSPMGGRLTQTMDYDAA
jgi:DNA mismatch repair protein MutS